MPNSELINGGETKDSTASAEFWKTNQAFKYCGETHGRTCDRLSLSVTVANAPQVTEGDSGNCGRDLPYGT